MNIIKEMIKLEDNMTRSGIEHDHDIHGHYTTIRLYRVDYNIVHILKDKVYLGKGYTIGEINDIQKHIKNNKFDRIKYTTEPILITRIPDNREMKRFITLLKYEKKEKNLNIKINIGDYSRWIENDIPNQIACANNTCGKYELRGIDYYKETSSKGVIVDLFLDDYYMEDFVEYYIPEHINNVKDSLERIADYQGEICKKNKNSIIKI